MLAIYGVYFNAIVSLWYVFTLFAITECLTSEPFSDPLFYWLFIRK